MREVALVAPATPTAVGWLGYLLIGAVAGWLAARLVNGNRTGILINVAAGVCGGFVGGQLLGWAGVDVEHGHRWVTFAVSLGGAVVLLGLVHLIAALIRR